ncbi:hypothetical protein Q9L58_008687 [Maublancomyces gigas]|uniref:Uncharacterized protein n=1 Tax=Discina gigas TaxID=1032678 RepID=A0ABR3G907_9PEZI
MNFRGFAQINTPDNVRETAGRPPPDTPESPSSRKNTRRERKELDKATALTPSINPSYIKLREQYGLEEALDILIGQQTSVAAKITVAIQILDAVQNVTEEIGGVEEAMWERVIERHQLWEPMGGRQKVKGMMEYESQAGPRIAQRKEESGRKRRAREAIGSIWGEGWEERFDPEQRLLEASEHALQNLAARAREGWKMEVVQRSADDAFRARIMDRRQGVTMRQVYTKKDTEDGTESLRRAEAESGKRKEGVTLEDLERALPRAPGRSRLTIQGTGLPGPAPRRQTEEPRAPTQQNRQVTPVPPSSPTQRTRQATSVPPSPSPPPPTSRQSRRETSTSQEELRVSPTQTEELRLQSEEQRTPSPQLPTMPLRVSSSPPLGSPDSDSDSVIIIDDPGGPPRKDGGMGFRPEEAKRLNVEGTMALVQQGYTVEQFDPEWSTDLIEQACEEDRLERDERHRPQGGVPPGPVRRRRRARSPPREIRRSARGMESEGLPAGLLCACTVEVLDGRRIAIAVDHRAEHHLARTSWQANDLIWKLAELPTLAHNAEAFVTLNGGEMLEKRKASKLVPPMAVASAVRRLWSFSADAVDESGMSKALNYLAVKEVVKDFHRQKNRTEDPISRGGMTTSIYGIECRFRSTRASEIEAVIGVLGDKNH